MGEQFTGQGVAEPVRPYEWQAGSLAGPSGGDAVHSFQVRSFGSRGAARPVSWRGMHTTVGR